jgi:alkane 1-monooxygenase
VFLALIPVGASLGGVWTFMAAAVTPLGLASLDSALGDDAGSVGPDGAQLPRWLPRVYILVQLAVTAWAAIRVSLPGTPLVDSLGLAVSSGVTTGVFGFVAAHEMIHSRDRGEQALGLTLLGSVFYMHFRIAHLYGHHRRAATFEDPASARLGEGLYGFLLRSIGGQFAEAWRFETQRGGGRGKPANRMIRYLAIEAAVLVVIALSGWRPLLFMLLVAAIAVGLLESFNYVAHYGLTRRVGLDGRAERLAAHHSWNSRRWMNNASLFNMGRHSDHHRRMTRSYEALEPVEGAAELPSGYASALLLALVPPLWRRVMDPRAEAVAARPIGPILGNAPFTSVGRCANQHHGLEPRAIPQERALPGPAGHGRDDIG